MRDEDLIRMEIQRKLMLIALVIVIITVGLINLFFKSDRVSDEEMLQRQYCEMVDIWDRSGGEYGWPPYRGREICN